MKVVPTKSELRDQLGDATLARGGELIRLGGDCYVARLEGEIRLAVSLKESDQSKKMWVGSPEPMTRLLGGRYEFSGTDEQLTTRVDRVFIVMIHKPVKTVLLIPLHQVWKAIYERSVADRTNIEWSFDLERIGYHKYVVKRDAFRSDLTVDYVDWLRASTALMDLPLAGEL
jgi:hypothetical protein